MPTRREWLDDAARQLADAGIASAQLDSELLLTHALGVSRTTLHAHTDEPLADTVIPILDAMMSLRVIRVPVAYIVGHREFYGRLFKVTPSVLIPRPETEDIIEIFRELSQESAFASLIDVGTGSGALAVTLALEHPALAVYGTDISRRALAVAKQNRDTYGAPVTLLQTDLLEGVDQLVTSHPLCVVANLPYVDADDERSPETAHEPDEALFAADNGLADITRLIDHTQQLLQTGDYLILESNPDQQPMIISKAINGGFTHEQTRRLITVFKRR